MEKLKETLSTDLWRKDGAITEAMDVFSAGWVLSFFAYAVIDICTAASLLSFSQKVEACSV